MPLGEFFLSGLRPILTPFCAFQIVRSRERKTQKAKWTEENLHKAIKAVENGVSKKKAAKDFEIPRSTLRDRLKSEQFTKPLLGRKPVFNPEQEIQIGINNELWYRCIMCSKWAHSECSGYESHENYICDF